MGSIQSETTPQLPLLDYHQLETFVVIGVADYLSLLDDVIEDIPAQLAQIRDCMEQGNFPQVKARAHGLRGLVAYFGCVAMTTRLARLENQAEFSPETAASIHLELQVVWEQSLAALRQWEKSHDGFGH